MKMWWLVFYASALMAPAFAQEAPRADANSPAEAEVTKAELEIAQLVVHADWDQYAACLMDDYSSSDRNGILHDKEATMSSWRAGQEKVLDLAPEELKIRIYGDTAIVSGHFTMVQRRNGRVDTFFSRETHVYLKRGGRWLLAASHATTVAK